MSAPHSLDAGGVSLAPSSARNAFTTLSNLRVVLSPPVPLVNALLEYFEMFGIRHRDTPVYFFAVFFIAFFAGDLFDALRFVLPIGRRASGLSFLSVGLSSAIATFSRSTAYLLLFCW
jgi:hypothetical protein